MRSHYGSKIVFVVRNNRAALDLIEKDHFRLHALKFTISRQEELELLRHIIATEKPRVIIGDLLKRCHDRSFMKKLKSAGNACVVAFTDVHKKAVVESDIVINCSLYQKKEYYQNINRTKYFLGYNYVILSPGYLTIKNNIEIRNHVERVLICMGGADHHNLTFTVLKAIDKSKHDFCCDVILSSAFFQKEKVADFVKKLHHKITVYYDIDGILDLLLQADMTITAGGNTHVDRMCAGVPGIVIDQLRHQAVSSQKIADFGATMDLGMYKGVSSESLLEAFNTLLENKNLRKRMSERGRLLVDGKGLVRVSDIIAKACEE
jgi:spore coat polysaccharide biosynthesis predicted glycosyltransferase SpsG